jgi:hypothetical protein
MSAARRSADMVAEYHPAVVDCHAAPSRRPGSGAQGVAQLLEGRAQIVAAFELVNLARACAYPLSQVAGALGELAEQLDLDWLGTAINRLPAGNRLAGTGTRSALRRVDQSSPAALAAGVGRLPAGDRPGRCRDSTSSRATSPQDLAMLSAGLAEARRLLAS